MIDSLFGSKTRVKLLHLFLNNPGKSFYVREITRLIDEQINSVRRELANMMNVGIIVSDNADNKLYYAVNQQYQYFEALSMIFADNSHKAKEPKAVAKDATWLAKVGQLSGLRLAIAAGTLVRGSASRVDLLVVGEIVQSQLEKLMDKAEKLEKKSLNYAVLSYDDFYYRLSVRDRFVTDILSGKHSVLVDVDRILK